MWLSIAYHQTKNMDYLNRIRVFENKLLDQKYDYRLFINNQIKNRRLMLIYIVLLISSIVLLYYVYQSNRFLKYLFATGVLMIILVLFSKVYFKKSNYAFVLPEKLQLYKNPSTLDVASIQIDQYQLISYEAISNHWARLSYQDSIYYCYANQLYLLNETSE